jgi:hypothetical protein
MGTCQCKKNFDELSEIQKDETPTPKINNEPIEKTESVNKYSNDNNNKKIDFNNIDNKNLNIPEDFNYVDNDDNKLKNQKENNNYENEEDNNAIKETKKDYNDDEDDNDNNKNTNNENNDNKNYYNNDNDNDNNNDNINEEQNNEIENVIDPNLTPDDEFSQYIFENINNIRTDPQSFISKIKDSENNITNDKHNRLIYKSKVKVALTKGLESFEEAIEILKETEPMDKLIYDPLLTIPLPNSEEEIKDKNYLKEKVNEIMQKRSVKSYWRDIVKDKETSFILTIVDDTGQKSGMKRKNILNPKIKYIGINSILIGKSFACYIILSDKDK